LLGGLVLILGAVLQLGGDFTGLLNLAPRLPSLGSLTDLLIAVIARILALAGIAQIRNPVWNIILLILGFIAGGLGGILVILGTLIALVANFV
jgi:hypothetical protein